LRYNKEDHLLAWQPPLDIIELSNLKNTNLESRFGIELEDWKFQIKLEMSLPIGGNSKNDYFEQVGVASQGSVGLWICSRHSNFTNSPVMMRICGGTMTAHKKSEEMGIYGNVTLELL